MKLKLILWIFVIGGTVLFSSACENLTLTNRLAKPDKVIIEISTYAGGNSYPTAHILDFRLYESGRVEYDVYPAQDPPRVTAQNVVITRKHFQVSVDEVKELISLVEQPDFQDAKEEYPMANVCCSSDAYFDRTVIYNQEQRQKKIVLRYRSDESQYPASLLELLKKAYLKVAKEKGQI